MNEFLQETFGDEALTFEQFNEKLQSNKDISLANIAGGAYVAKSEYDALSEQLSQAQGDSAKLKDYDPEWKTKLEQAKLDGEKALNEYKLSTEISKALTNANAADEVSVKANLDLKRIKIGEDGKLVGLDEQLKALKESKPFLFKTEQTILNLGGSTPGARVPKNKGGLKSAVENFYNGGK